MGLSFKNIHPKGKFKVFNTPTQIATILSGTEQAKLMSSDGQIDDQFGISVSISVDGSTAIVGARSEDTKASDAGAAYIFV